VMVNSRRAVGLRSALPDIIDSLASFGNVPSRRPDQSRRFG
jgi:hypothetical protein